MENAINTLRIQNFKSIKDATLEPRRVNLIIGQPNVGKSNILEAMSLLGAGLYDSSKFMGDILRYETLSNLFHDNDTAQPIQIESSKGLAIIKANSYNASGYKSVHFAKEFLNVLTMATVGDITEEERREIRNYTDYEIAYNILENEKYIDDISTSYKKGFFKSYDIHENGEARQRGRYTYFDVDLMPKLYIYKQNQPHENRYQFNFLQPPYGHNLLSIAQQNPALRKEISDLFKPYNLKIVLRVNERKFEIQKNIDDFVYNYPYSSIADTLQRIIFYLAAIESNKNSILLFEEPEAHSYPVYVSMLGKRIVESKSNQFFVATHSPYLITEVLEQMLPDEQQAQELAIFVAYYEDYQTKVKQLSDEEVRAIRNDGLDVFYNMDRYIPRPVNG